MFSISDTKKKSLRLVRCIWIYWTIRFICMTLLPLRWQFLSHVPHRRMWFTSTHVTLVNLAKQNTAERQLMISSGYTRLSFLIFQRQNLLFHKQAVLVRKTTGLFPWAQLVLTSIQLKPCEATLPPVILLKDYPRIIFLCWTRPVFQLPTWIYSLPWYTHFFLSQCCLQSNTENS